MFDVHTQPLEWCGLHRCPSRTTWMYPEGGTHFTGNHNIKSPIGHLTLRGPGQRRHHGIRNGNQTPSYQSIMISTYRGKHGSFVLIVFGKLPHVSVKGLDGGPNV